MDEQIQSKLPSYNHTISRHFFQLFFVLLITFAIGIYLYGEPFRFWQDALSDLGCTVTRMGAPNPISRWVFAMGMVMESLILMRVRAEYSSDQGFRNQQVKRMLALLGAIGFLAAILPNDHFHGLHSVGVGMVVGALYFFGMLYHWELKDQLIGIRFALDIALLQAAVFPYAVSFFLDWDSKQSFQKFCIIGVFFVLLRSVSISEESFEPKEIFRNLGSFFG